jgi:hypothetical protein
MFARLSQGLKFHSKGTRTLFSSMPKRFIGQGKFII